MGYVMCGTLGAATAISRPSRARSYHRRWPLLCPSPAQAIGLYYENAIFSNVVFDRPAREATGLFFGAAFPCPAGQIELPDGSIQSVGFCGQPIGSVAPQII